MTELRTFRLPASIDGTRMDVEMGKQMILALRLDRRFRIELGGLQQRQVRSTLELGRRFFAGNAGRKAHCTSDLSYSGYFAPGERIIDGEPDGDERFTVCKDIAVEDPRVQAQWPCHGPVPWPDEGLRAATAEVMSQLGGIGARLLRLVALGLEIFDMDSLVRLTGDGWHHLSLMGGAAGRATAADGDTGCGMLVMGVHDDPRMLTVSAGDSLQFLTRGYLSSTGPRGPLGGTERPALVYFHEPNFQVTLEPLDERPSAEMHYGRHFTATHLRRHPERLTTWRILAENRLAVFGHLSGMRRAA